MTDEPHKTTDEPRDDSADAAAEALGGNGQSESGDDAAPSDTAPHDVVVGEETAAEEAAAELTAETPTTGSPEPTVQPIETDESDDDAADEIPPKDWYILKVQSNREDTIREALLRRVKVDGLDDYFGEVIVPTEMVTEFKNGKKKVVKRKLYPGYIMIQMAVNDDTWFLVRDIPGIGDFTGAGGKPIPMQEHEVSRLLAKQEEKTTEAPKLQISFKAGDRVKINEGTFENFEGEVDTIDEANGRVTVMINIFGRSTPVELEYWQIESV